MKIKTYLLLFFFYLIFSLFLFLPIFKLDGVIVGGDWNMPETKSQVEGFFSSYLNSWSNTSNFFGTRQISNTSFLYALIIYLLSLAGISSALISKLISPLIFAFAATNMNLLLRSYKIKPTISFLFGLVFITTPLFFNYSLMGWQFVLFSLSLMPLFIYFFQLSLESKSGINYLLISAIIFSLAVVQSQTLIWYPLVMLAVILANLTAKKEFLIRATKNFFLVILFFFLFNLYWLPAMLFFPDPGVSGSSMINSSISLGTTLRLNVVNLLRGWGSLFNYQFESSYPPGFLILTFILIFLSLTIFLWQRKVNKNWLVFLILLLVPIAFYKIDRNLLASLPFSNIIRDIARFSVLSTLSLTILAAFATNQFFLIKNTVLRNFLFFCFGFALILNAWPALSWEMFSYPRGEADFRFRAYKQTVELSEFEKKINQEKNLRVLYLPVGGLINLEDQRFDGEFEKIWDTQAAYSKNPGVIVDSDRGQGKASELFRQLNLAIKDRNINQLNLLAKIARINILVFRRDGKYYDWKDEDKRDFENQLRKLVADDQAEIYFDQGDVLAIKYKDSESLIQVNQEYALVGSSLSEVAKKIYPEIFSSNLLSEGNFDQDYSLLTIKELIDQPLISRDNQILSDLNPNAIFFAFHKKSDIYNIVNNKKVQCFKDSKNYRLKTNLLNQSRECYQKLSGVKCENNLCDDYYSVLPDNISFSAELVLVSDQNGAVVFNDQIYDLDKAKKEGQYLRLKVDNLKPGLNRLQSDNAKPIFIQIINNKLVPTIDLEYEKIGPGKYKINLNKDGLKLLSFYQNFDHYWRIYNDDNLLSSAISSDDKHFIVDSYANGWLIDTDKFNGDLYIVYWPQKLLIIGSFLSITILILAIIYLVINRHGYEI